MAMDSDERDFLLHLYDKLWENMDSKEARLWNYLSVYGAAIALAFAVGEFADIQLYALAVILALTVWALLIIINANWWYRRNQLIVTRIENKFPEAVRGVVPKSYRDDPRFSFDRLYRGSAGILVTVAVVLYSIAMLQYIHPRSIDSLDILVSLVVLYLLTVLAVGYCLTHHESYFPSYYRGAKEKLLQEAGAKSNCEIREDLRVQELEARNSLDWRLRAFVVLIIVSLCFDFALGMNASATGRLIFAAVALQFVAAYLYLRLRSHYRNQDLLVSELDKYTLDLYLFRKATRAKKWWESNAWIPRLLSILVLISVLLLSAGVLISQPNSMNSATKTLDEKIDQN
jgi:hypothetical protein